MKSTLLKALTEQWTQPELLAANTKHTLVIKMAELEKQKDLTLRAEAELQNVLKRTAREVENAHKYGLERFIQNLLQNVLQKYHFEIDNKVQLLILFYQNQYF